MSVEPARVSLREITAETVIAITRLAVADSQKGFVAPNAISLAQALFAPEAWYRAIYLDDAPVGCDAGGPAAARCRPSIRDGVWRFMIDARHQGQGMAGRLGLVIERCEAASASPSSSCTCLARLP
jgi:diamine N-acetyltransferase